MERSERRRQAQRIKKGIEKMSLSQVEKAVQQIYVEGVQDGLKQGYNDGLKQCEILFKKGLKDIYGFGDKRWSRLVKYIDSNITENCDTNK